MTYQEVFGVASTTSNSTEKPFYTPIGQRATRMKCFTRVHVGQLLRLLLHDTLKKKKTKLQNYIVQSERRIKVASRLTLQQLADPLSTMSKFINNLMRNGSFSSKLKFV